MPTGTVRSFADLHCHTSASFDSLSRPASVVAAAAARGLTHIAITDHERIDGALRAREAAPIELTVIVGEEVRTTGGDMIGLYLERSIPMGLSPLETAAAIREQGALVGLPHPFDRFRVSGGRRNAEDALDELLPLVDYVEGWNARVLAGSGNRLAAEFAVARGLPAVAVSDAHTVLEVGVAYTMLDGLVDGPAELRLALADARLVTGRSSRLVRAATPVAKLVQRMRGNRRVRPHAAGSR
ncbi:CehA/McbA family metallohydrolase [soil metagenome]